MKLDLHRVEDAQEADWRAKFLMASDAALSYSQTLEFALSDAEDPDGKLQFAGADQASLDYHDKILALIEKERLAGRTMTFLEAARRIEAAQARSR